MLKKLLKSCVRTAIGLTNGATVPVVRGPLKGRRMLRQHGLPNLSMLFGTYEGRFAKAFSGYVKGQGVIYDIGANIGYFSLLAAQQHDSSGSVHAFEPVPKLVDDLESMATANGLDTDIVAHKVALSDSVGKLKLYTPSTDETGILQTALGDRVLSEETAIEVPTLTMDSFVFDDRNAAPDVIKLDVEGAEGSVLQGAQRVMREHQPVILVEVHGEPPAAEVWDAIQQVDYSLSLLTENGELPIADRETWLRHFGKSRWTIQHCVLSPTSLKAVA